MNNYRTGIAEELVRREVDVRASLFGRIVWRNWAMDKYKTRRGDWFRLGKGDEEEAAAAAAAGDKQGTAGNAPAAGHIAGAGAANGGGGGGGVMKSAIQVRLRLCLRFCNDNATQRGASFPALSHIHSPLPPHSAYAHRRRSTPSFLLLLAFQKLVFPDLITNIRSPMLISPPSTYPPVTCTHMCMPDILAKALMRAKVVFTNT